MRHFYKALAAFSVISVTALHSSGTLMTPEEAINLAMTSEPLQFHGKFIPPDSESAMASCIFRNSKVTILYDYCTKKEQPAYGITIHSADPSRGHVIFYAEGSGAPVSKLKRKDYLYFLYFFSANKNASGYNPNLTVSEYAEYYDRRQVENSFGCLVSQRYGTTAPRTNCETQFASQAGAWSGPAITYWNNPSPNWYKLQNRLRTLIETQPKIKE